MKKKLLTSIAAIALPSMLMAQGWPAAYQGVMLQGFYWDSYNTTTWRNLEKQADELSEYFKLVWVPQSGNCGHLSMGYDDLYWFDHNSSFGTEQELRSMINTFSRKGIGTIADVVVNHRNTLTNWVDFPAETYNGTTYQLLPSDICADDDQGKTAAWAKGNGYQLSTNKDTGDDFSGCRDLDHNSQNVQQSVKAYLSFLLNDLGYAGVRYDMVKGYDAKFTAIYNSAAKPRFSVGEYFDYDKQKLTNWLEGTAVDGQIQSAAFDFPARNVLRNAANNGNWALPVYYGGLADSKSYCRYAVTFVENHDTEKRQNANQDPLKKDTLAANAFIMAMPGTPCVFYKHWTDCKSDIKNMILLRNLAGINSESEWARLESRADRYVFRTTGTNARLLAAVGPAASSYAADGSTWAVAAEGYHWRYWMERSAETVMPSLPSGEYVNTCSITLHAISKDSGARIVYTLDGSAPTANSTQLADGSAISLGEGDHTLKAALLTSDGKVGSPVERHYSIKEFKAHAITVYVNADQAGWTSINSWSWGGDGTHTPINTKWPGDAMTATTVIGGKTWHTVSHTMNSQTDFVSFVFSTDKGSSQTVDVAGINADTFIEILPTMNNGKHLFANVTDQYASGIENTTADASATSLPTRVLAIDGTTLRRFPRHATVQEALAGLPHGLYIVDGKKIAK